MMENITSLTKQDIKRIANIVKEQIDVSEYEDSDFIEVFVKYFRPWIKKFHGDEVGEYPMSHLVAKYLKDFKDQLCLFKRVLCLLISFVTRRQSCQQNFVLK